MPLLFKRTTFRSPFKNDGNMLIHNTVSYINWNYKSVLLMPMKQLGYAFRRLIFSNCIIAELA